MNKYSCSLYLNYLTRLIIITNQLFSVQFSSVAQSFPTLRPQELRLARPPCPSPTPRDHSDSRPSSRWCHPAISSSVVPFSPCPQSLPASGSFSSESALCTRWPKYWSFSFNISPSNEHPGLISFRTDWLDLLAVRSERDENTRPPNLLLEKTVCRSGSNS